MAIKYLTLLDALNDIPIPEEPKAPEAADSPSSVEQQPQGSIDDVLIEEGIGLPTEETAAPKEDLVEEPEEWNLATFKSYLSRKSEQILRPAVSYVERIEKSTTKKHLDRKIMTFLCTHLVNLFAEVGLFDRALWAAERERIDSKELYKKIAVAQAKAGKHDEARLTVARIRDGIREPEEYRYKAYKDVALEQIEAKAFAEAEKTMEKMDDRFSRSHFYSAMASAQAKAGMPENAKLTAEKIKGWNESEGFYDKSKIYLEIASILAEEGKPQQSIKALRQLMPIAERALMTAGGRMVRDKDKKSELYLAIACAQMIVGMDDESSESIRIARELSSKNFEERLYKCRVFAFSKQGRFEEAIQEAGNIEDLYRRSHLYKIVASEQIKKGLYEEAKKTAEMMDTYKQWVWDDIALAQAEAGQFRKALQTAESRPYTYSKILTLAGESEDNKEEAKKVIELALEYAKKLFFNPERRRFGYSSRRSSQTGGMGWEDLYPEILSAQIKLGMCREAEETLDFALQAAAQAFPPDFQPYLESYSKIAIAQAKLGLLEQALQTAENIKCYDGMVVNHVNLLKLQTYMGIMSALAESGKYAEASKALQLSIDFFANRRIGGGLPRLTIFKEAYLLSQRLEAA